MPNYLQFGRDACVGAAEEVTYGTAVTPLTHFIRVLSCDLSRKVNKAPRANLTSGSGSASRRAHAVLEDDAGGKVETEILFEGLGLFLYHLMGAKSTTGPTGAIYTHLYKHASTLPIGLTLERTIGRDADGALRAEVFEGCKINTVELSWSAGSGVGKMSFDIIAETTGGITAGSAPTFTANDVPVEYHQFASLTFNSVTYTPKSVNVTIDNKLAVRRRLGSKNTAEPHRTDAPEFKIKAVIEMDQSTLQAALTADTQGDVVVTFNGTSLRVFKITGHNGYLTTAEHPSTTPGIVDVTVEWMCEGDGTDHGLQIEVQNTQATAIAA